LTLYVLPRLTSKQIAKRNGNAAKPGGSLEAPTLPQSRSSEPSKTNALSLREASLKPLVGFAIAKKVMKSACKRNRCKRRAREAYRAVRQSKDESFVKGTAMHSWYAYIWVIGPTTLTVDFEEIKRSVRDCLLKANKKFGRTTNQ
jgi:ribonuclease P protein component